MKHKIEIFDRTVIIFLRNHEEQIARCALFIIFFWFGILKVFLLSPAGPLVTDLLQATFLGWIQPETFIKLFGIFEVIISGMILIPKIERITFAILLLHLFTTVLPLFVIPHHVWDSVMVPNLIGQYIIKNITLLSLGLVLFARLTPMTKSHSVLQR